MDREIPKEVRDKERKKKFIKYGAVGVAAVVCIAVLISFMRSSVNKKDLVFSEVDNGTIEVSVSASGKVVPAFEEIINSPINTRIVDRYGEATISNILYSVRSSKNVEKSLYYVTGVPYKELMEDWFRTYYVIYTKESKIGEPIANELLTKPNLS